MTAVGSSIVGRRVLLLLTLVALPLRAQSLAARVAAAGDDAVTFHFAARPGVCGDGERFIRTGRHSYHGSFSGGDYDMSPCIEGPVQVRLALEHGEVRRVQAWVGPLRDRNARDLGVVPAPEAARYLLDVAQRGPATASAKAIFPAVLADSSVVWPTLLAIAKTRETPSRSTRRDAMFWLSRFAAGTLRGNGNDPFAADDDDDADDPDDDLKVQAVFVLSQLPRDEGIPELLNVARSNKNLRVRSAALFWLGQSGDPRALALFESLLRP